MTVGVDQRLDGIAAIGRRLPGRVQAARHDLAQGLAGLASLGDGQHGVRQDMLQRHGALAC